MDKIISPKITALTFGVLTIAFLAAFYVIAWQEPSQTPPEANVSAPINVGTTPQAKAGRISATEFYDYNDPSFYLNPSGKSKLGPIDSPSIKQYRMAECKNECSGACTAQCVATCSAGYQIVSSCRGQTTEPTGNWPSGFAMYSCTMKTPGPCEGNACSHSFASFGSTYFASVVVRLLCESGGPILAIIGDPCTSGDDCYSGFCYIDADGDRYSPASGTKTCQVNSQLAGTDCNDSSANAYPGNTFCGSVDRIDNDCNGSTDDCCGTTCTTTGVLCGCSYSAECCTGSSVGCGTVCYAPGYSCSGNCVSSCQRWVNQGSCCYEVTCTGYK